MRRQTLGKLAVPALLLVVMTVPVLARAFAVPAPFPQQNKLQVAELIVTGQVVAIEDQDIKAPIAPNVNNLVTYRIAVVQVTETIKGKIEGKMIRVGFLPPQQPVPVPGGVPGQPGGVAPGLPPAIGPAIQPLPAIKPAIQPLPPVQAGQAQAGQAQAAPAVQPIAQPQPAIQPAPIQILPAQPGVQPFPGKIGFPGGVNYQLAVGNDGLFYLQKHHTGKFHTIVQSYNSFVSSQTNKEQYDNEVGQVRALVKVTADPIGALKAANAEDRLDAASVLIKQYRQPMGPAKLDSVSEEESKLILKVLLESDWNMAKYQGNNYQKNPAVLFNMLGLQPKDNWQQPVGKGLFQPEYTQAAKTWLEKNWQTYRIQKYVSTGGKFGGPIGVPVPGGPPQIQPFPVDAVPVPVPAPVPLPPVQGGGQVAPGGVIQIQPAQVDILPLPPVQVPNKE